MLTRERRRSLAMLATMAALMVGVWFNNERGLSAIARQTHDGLCALRDDVERRRDVSIRYLQKYPDGVVSPVTNAVIITAAQIQQGIDNQTATLTALDRAGLVC